MIRLSKTGMSFCVLSIGLYVVSMQSESGLLFLILGILFGCFVLNALGAGRAVAKLELTPSRSITCAEGDPLKGVWQVCNTDKHPIGLVDVVSDWGSLFRIGVVAPGQTIHATPELRFADRGVYQFSECRLRSCYPWGLVSFTRDLKVSGEFVVRPRAYICAPPPAAGFEPVVGGAFSGPNRSPSGNEFHGIRPMQPNDPMKFIHWPSSAKGLGIQVREFDEELSGRTSLLLDVTASVTSGRPGLNAACRAAASLLLAGLDAGNQTDLALLNGVDAPVTVPPFADGATALDLLARVESCPKPPRREIIIDILAVLSSRAALCFVLQELHKEILQLIDEVLLPEGRRVALYLPERYEDTYLNPDILTRFYSDYAIESDR